MLKNIKLLSKVVNFQPNYCFRSEIRRFHINSLLCSDEVEKAKEAAKSGSKANSTIFDKIINKEIPVKLLYEDEKCLAFNDIAPQAPVHFLVIPKQRIDMIENATENDRNVTKQ